jgi:hypothetical protein
LLATRSSSPRATRSSGASSVARSPSRR